MKEPLTEPVPPARLPWVVLVLTALSLLLAGALSSRALYWIDCAGSLVQVPEPAGWRHWPSERGEVRGRGADETLFGFRFTHRAPRGFSYGGYEDAELTDPTLCHDSRIDLDNWLRAGEYFWLRHPEELSLYRDPHGGVLVIAGRYGYDPDHSETEPPRFVTAFERDLTPRRGFQHAGPWSELWFWGLGLCGVGVTALRVRRSPSGAVATKLFVATSVVFLLLAAARVVQGLEMR
jgi:hypothetical protein